jgi:hypothetical protein
MNDSQEARTLRATYRSRAEAERAASTIRRQGFTPSIDQPADERAVLRAEMRDEVESTVVGAGNVGPFTKSMTKGIVAGVPAAALIGAILGGLAGLIPWGFGMSTVLRVVLGIGIGGFAGAVVGFMLGGFVKSRMDKEGEGRLDAEAGSIVSIRTTTSDEARRVREFLESGDPIRIDETAHGVPIGPSSEEKAKPVSGESPASAGRLP